MAFEFFFKAAPVCWIARLFLSVYFGEMTPVLLFELVLRGGLDVYAVAELLLDYVVAEDGRSRDCFRSFRVFLWETELTGFRKSVELFFQGGYLFQKQSYFCLKLAQHIFFWNFLIFFENFPDQNSLKYFVKKVASLRENLFWNRISQFAMWSTLRNLMFLSIVLSEYWESASWASLRPKLLLPQRIACFRSS